MFRDGGVLGYGINSFIQSPPTYQTSFEFRSLINDIAPSLGVLPGQLEKRILDTLRVE